MSFGDLLGDFVLAFDNSGNQSGPFFLIVCVGLIQVVLVLRNCLLDPVDAVTRVGHAFLRFLQLAIGCDKCGAFFFSSSALKAGAAVESNLTESIWLVSAAILLRLSAASGLLASVVVE